MLLAWRPRDLENAYLPFLGGEGIANYTSDPVFRASLGGGDPQQAVLRWVSVFPHPTATWEKLRFVREHTDLPLVLKGILDPEDARRAADEGADGVLVSNHGGRQVDGSTATLDALPRVVEAVGDRLPVLLDSGVRTGADALKAMALGARAVLLGRPYVWGLAVGGEDGVRQVLRAFLADLDLTLGLTGRTRPADLDPSMLARA
jgi:isopentenyl diphosphate isomerase/L-lactate dehydrogenase-like FMN-dependent dehydrogenase